MAETIKGKNGNGTQDGQVGRPETELNMKTLIQCAKIQCTKEEAAAVCEVSADTIDRRLADMGTNWTDFYAEHAAGGKASLRRALFKSAIEDGNVTSQIWLSKQHLGMKDRTEHGFDPDKPAVFKLNMGKKLNEEELDND